RQEKGLRLKLPASLLYSLRVIGRGSVNDLILRILREYRPDSKSRGYGRDTISQLDKLYFNFYPYPGSRNFTEDKINSKVGRFALMCPVHIYELVQKSHSGI